MNTPLPPDFFDAPLDRAATDSLKWRAYESHPDVLPLWVADMDFRSAPAITEALLRRAALGDFGYVRDSREAAAAMTQYHLQQDGLAIEPEWIVPVPGLVCALNILCRAVGRPGDAVATTVPVYPPFLEAPRLSDRQLVTAPMTRDAAGRPAFDLNALEAALTPSTRLFILCNPHNPLGRVWNPNELRDLLELCHSRDILVCSDEVHGGLVLDPPHAYTPAALAAPRLADRLVTLLSPSKTFNLPGLACAFAVLPDSTLRRRFREVMAGIVPQVNLFGWTAAEAAYRSGEPWRHAVLARLRANRDTVLQAAAAAHIDMPRPEATYLAWLDFREQAARLGLTRSPAAHLLEHGVALNDGANFGTPGFARLNFATRPQILHAALERIAQARLFA